MKAIPNIISIFRICLVPVFVFAYFTDARDIKIFAVIVYAVAGLSDLLDGYLARRLDAQSKLGKLLDPLGDKLMTFTVMVCIAIDNIDKPFLIWAVMLMFIKEALLGIGGLVMHKKAHAELLPANVLGKTSTFVFFVVCVTLMVYKNIPDITAILLISAAIGMTLISLGSYLIAYIKIMKARNKNGAV